MASKKVNKVVKESCCAPACAPMKSRLYLSLEGQDVAQIKSLAVGEKVQILVTGTVKGLSQRERVDYDDSKKKVKTGDIDLEDYRVEVVGDEENEFTKMADSMEHDDD
jgi:hypothetical protein